MPITINPSSTAVLTLCDGLLQGHPRTSTRFASFVFVPSQVIVCTCVNPNSPYEEEELFTRHEQKYQLTKGRNKALSRNGIEENPASQGSHKQLRCSWRTMSALCCNSVRWWPSQNNTTRLNEITWPRCQVWMVISWHILHVFLLIEMSSITCCYLLGAVITQKQHRSTRKAEGFATITNAVSRHDGWESTTYSSSTHNNELYYWGAAT